MWRKEDVKSPGAPQSALPPSPAASATSLSSVPAASSATHSAPPVSSHAMACITQGIRIKGEVTGKEDLFVDGTLEGRLDLGNATVTIGPNGKVKADISAREIVVRGQVDGKIEGTERVQLWNSGRVTGEVRTERLAIEDGAVLRGKVEAGKSSSKGLENRAKNAASDSSEKPKSSSAAASSHTAVI
jgi:cytoskeletal protein CcmA (bactofilin family)